MGRHYQELEMAESTGCRFLVVVFFVFFLIVLPPEEKVM